MFYLLALLTSASDVTDNIQTQTPGSVSSYIWFVICLRFVHVMKYSQHFRDVLEQFAVQFSRIHCIVENKRSLSLSLTDKIYV